MVNSEGEKFLEKVFTNELNFLQVPPLTKLYFWVSHVMYQSILAFICLLRELFWGIELSDVQENIFID